MPAWRATRLVQRRGTLICSRHAMTQAPQRIRVFFKQAQGTCHCILTVAYAPRAPPKPHTPHHSTCDPASTRNAVRPSRRCWVMTALNRACALLKPSSALGVSKTCSLTPFSFALSLLRPLAPPLHSLFCSFARSLHTRPTCPTRPTRATRSTRPLASSAPLALAPRLPSG